MSFVASSTLIVRQKTSQITTHFQRSADDFLLKHVPNYERSKVLEHGSDKGEEEHPGYKKRMSYYYNDNCGNGTLRGHVLNEVVTSTAIDVKFHRWPCAYCNVQFQQRHVEQAFRRAMQSSSHWRKWQVESEVLKRASLPHADLHSPMRSWSWWVFIV